MCICNFPFSVGSHKLEQGCPVLGPDATLDKTSPSLISFRNYISSLIYSFMCKFKPSTQCQKAAVALLPKCLDTPSCSKDEFYQPSTCSLPISRKLPDTELNVFNSAHCCLNQGYQTKFVQQPPQHPWHLLRARSDVIK